jgi:hypothetical protein
MLGFGVGKIEIKLSKFNFRPGETIEGVVELKLKKPLKAKELRIEVYGERISRSTGVGVIESGSSGNSRQRIFSFKQPLDGEKEYPATPEPLRYAFKIILPANLSDQKLPEGTLGTIAKSVDLLAGTTRSTKWYIEARLRRPMKFDVKKKVQINSV